MLSKMFAKVVVGAVLACVATPALAVDPPYIFDWNTRIMGYYGWPIYTPVAHPGHDGPITSMQYTNLYSTLNDQGRPLAIMLQPDSAPVAGATYENALATSMATLPRLDFVFSDFEDENRHTDSQAVVDLIRSSSNLNVNQAYIGNYNDYAGAANNAAVWPTQVDRSADDAFYRSSGLNVSMPSIYPYEYYANHTNSNWDAWGSNTSPNKRSALFWAPLEVFSTAKRNLPEGHLLIPWTAGFIAANPGEPYDADPPPEADVIALIQHVRLRGADGFYRLGPILSNEPGFTLDPVEDAQSRQDMYDAWHSLDFIFTGDPVTILNLATNKTGGLEWSGVEVGNQVAILISNLSSTSQRILLPDIVGLPTYSDYIAPNTHVLKVYMVPEPGSLAIFGLALMGGLSLRRRV